MTGLASGSIIDTMKKDPRLWKRPSNGVYYVVYYNPPLYLDRRMHSLQTRDRDTADEHFFLWRRRREREQLEGVRLGITLGDAGKEYMRHFAKRNRPNSVSRYRKALDHFEDFVGADLPLNSLDVATVQDYQLHRSSQVEPQDRRLRSRRPPGSRRRRWVRENVASKELVERLYRPAGKESEARRVFTDEELRLLLDYDDPKWPDAGAILATLYYTGMRIGELGHLTRKDVRLGKRLVRIRSKELRVPVRGKRDPQQVEWVPPEVGVRTGHSHRGTFGADPRSVRTGSPEEHLRTLFHVPNRLPGE
jgi:integrase